MKTKEQIIAEYKLENPKLYKGIDNEVFEMTAEEYESACNEYADIQLQIIEKEQEVLDKANQKQALLEKLGITEEEARLLLS